METRERRSEVGCGGDCFGFFAATMHCRVLAHEFEFELKTEQLKALSIKFTQITITELLKFAYSNYITSQVIYGSQDIN